MVDEIIAADYLEHTIIESFVPETLQGFLPIARACSFAC
jgi:hypothetical protein